MRRPWIALGIVAALAAAGCAHAERPRPGRWQIGYRPHDSDRKDNTLLVDTATGRTWFFDISQTRWWEIPRNNVEDGPPEASIRLDFYDVKDITGNVTDSPAGDIHPQTNGWKSPPPEPCPTRTTGDALVDLIRETVRPDAWENQGWTVEYREPGTLVVKAPAEAHDRIRRILATLRETP